MNCLGFTDLLKQRSRVVKKVPKGTSSYQAEWILDEGDESGEEGDEYDDLQHEGFMEEESQVRKWAAGPPVCTTSEMWLCEASCLRVAVISKASEKCCLKQKKTKQKNPQKKNGYNYGKDVFMTSSLVSLFCVKKVLAT